MSSSQQLAGPIGANFYGKRQMPPNLQVSYDRHADVLYITVKRAPADSREDLPGLLWRYSLKDGDLVGLTIMDYASYWQPRLDELIKQLADRFQMSSSSAREVLKNAH